MATACEAELCPNWTGHGCICEVLDLDKPQRCRDCGCLDADHNDVLGYTDCTACGDCDGWIAP